MQAPVDPEATIKKAREELEAALRKKRAVDKQLVGLISLTCGLAFLTRTAATLFATVLYVECVYVIYQAMLEQNLYAFESSYLTETSMSGGNIITGFDAYLKPSAASKKRHEITDNDRIFSNSSFTIHRVRFQSIPLVPYPKLTTLLYTVHQSLETNTGPPTPPQGDFPLPQTVALQPQGADSSLSMRRAKRSRREREGTRGTSDGEESVTTVSRSRPGKRVRME